MSTKSIQTYLSNLGYSPDEISNNLHDRTFTHSLLLKDQSVKIHYVFVKTNLEIYERHRSFWNKNSETVFIAVGEEKSYLINAKAKPDRHSPLKKGICIHTFDYGINSKGYEKINIEKITKEYINSTYFFEFVWKNQKKKQEVDKDLLLNLLALRHDLLKDNNEQVIHLLILRCLFVKYLEDRGIFEKKFLVKKLQSNKPENLLDAFDEVCNINGDVFGGIRLSKKEIKIEYLKHLARFFECDYQSGQGTFFPYEFNNIPIQLISHVYEAFLKSDLKKGKGIYYTPSFVVDFMLSQTLKKVIKENKSVTILDPAVGSAAFLVESFKIIQNAYGEKITFEKKKKILESQLFGIDIDENALQIAAFSLYLALLETENSDFIKKQIETSSPILPPLIGRTLQKANTITENPFQNKTFDLIISNPPWGLIKTNEKEEKRLIKSEQLYKPIHPRYPQRSQAFILKSFVWVNNNTNLIFIVNSSNLFSEYSENFRQEFVKKFKVDKVFELSDYKSILFKPKIIGEINKISVKVGAKEPATVFVFKKNIEKEKIYKIELIKPRINNISKLLDLISYGEKDKLSVSNILLADNDYLWKTMLTGDEDIELLIKKIKNNKDESVKALLCEQGVQGQELPFYRLNSKKLNVLQVSDDTEKKLRLIEKKLYPNKNELKSKVLKIVKSSQPNIDTKRFIENIDKYIYQTWEKEEVELKPFLQKATDIITYDIVLEKSKTKNYKKIDWKKNYKRKRKEILYVGKRLIISRMPTKSDGLRIKSIFTDRNIVYSDSFIGLKLKTENYLPYFAILNSSLAGFYLVTTSSQWNRGTQNSLKNNEISNFPFPRIDKNDPLIKQIVQKVNNLQDDFDKNFNEIDELIFNLYGLLEYEKEIIREFYQVRVDRADEKHSKVNKGDMQRYFETFRDTFSNVLSPENTIKASYHISQNVGAIICLSIVEKNEAEGLDDNPDLQILNFVKSKQLQEAETFKVLNEEKVKIYDKKQFFIIKSNLFKDWTVRQAMKDAREEISLLLSRLPDVHE